ncbi:hydrogenase (NiFe) small subunit HydA [Hydrogenobaculum sp. SN]|nr:MULTISPECIES: hydrogenase small subunit [unclassified Hydrogenobaculum]AEF18465.1 hydrogenase (NiFe) small subunit HydA [Hydrogenobaculum sp. 3684]AEG45755.1 hydrogenase (NiFe) small subunit HydA [Hydrogenobaculum sp. SHO]AGG14397.1 hydrogenase (NiFe) small subunit HydA [Hydrogenobaculum sp. HO]AGH92701.1 hydrogenase (NiFe) small subunit HydA [Hydrogenobaculum sp. SN]
MIDGKETFWEALKRHGVSRREFMKFSAIITGLMGLPPAFIPKVVEAMETKPRVPVIWVHGLECTCCSESFIRSATPLASDVLLTMISLEYDDTLSAAAGEALEKHKEDIMKKYHGEYILAVEGNPPLGDDGMYCVVGGKPFLEGLKKAAEGAKAVIAWGSCASWGCVQAAKPNPTTAVPIHKVITDKPIVKIPGCPPIPEVMTGTIMYTVLFGKLPPLDSQGRPKMFYGNRIHDTCYRRPFFNEGMFVEQFDDEGAKKGWCLYKMGCRGPTTYNSCGNLRWYNGLSYPIQSGHGCIGCSADGFWDNGNFYSREQNIPSIGTESNANKVGAVAVGAAAAGAIAHGVISKIRSGKKED